MYKLTLLILIITQSCILSAQPIIQASDINPSVGESFVLTNTYYMYPGTGGNDVTWDLSGMNPISTINVQVNASSGTYPLSNIEINYVEPGTVIALAVGATEQEMVGQTKESIEYTYTEPQKLLTFPLTNTTNFTDNFEASYFSGVNFDRSGSTTVTVDGYGTLITPVGTFPNVLRVHQEITMEDVSVAGSIFHTIDIYAWYRAGIHMELAQVTSTISDLGSSNSGFYLTGYASLNEVQTSNISIYPNPTQEQLHIISEGQFTFTLTDSYGRIIFEGNGHDSAKVNTSDFPIGMYFISVYNGRSSETRKIFKN